MSGLADGAPMGQQRVAYRQVFEVLAERMHIGLLHPRATHMLAGDRREHRRRTLHRRALQVVLDCSHPAELFAAAGATRGRLV